MWNWKLFIQKFEKPIMILVGSVGLTAVLVNFDFSLLEANLYDFRMSRGGQRPADNRIVMITLDDRTTKALDEFSPLTLDFHAQFMEALEKFEPKAVGYLIDMNRVNQANPEQFYKTWGARFVDSALRMQEKGAQVLLGTPYDVTGEMVPPYPLGVLPHAIAVIHKDGNVFAEDKITRRALLSLNDKPAFHLELSRKIGRIGNDQPPRGAFPVAEVEGEYFFFRYHGSTVMSPEHPYELKYPRYSFIDVLNGKVPTEALKDKIVLVGTLSKEDSSDFAYTPFSKNNFTNPKIIVHANILDSLLHNDGIVRAPAWVNILATFAVVVTVISWVLTLTPLYGVFWTVTLGFIFLLFGQLIFQAHGFWIRASQPLVGVFVSYYLVVPYRLIREYKKRWDYQRKNEILTQVEELKTNFLNLVTHDLKTPVARIQGLTESILRKPSETERNHESLKNIIHATEELNRFITSILELSKLESNQLRLNLESKDVNQLVERAVERLEPQARSRGVTLIATLEPIFPIKVDASLISKVINNLIDNAIKYSPADSAVMIESREVDEEIEISVRDQGIGMTEEEITNLFTKFYRVKNDKTTQISGTGLGLYLTKYFVQAHRGRVTVESERGQGSIFRIYLPMNLNASHTVAPIQSDTADSAGPGLRSQIKDRITATLKSRGIRETSGS